MHECFLGRYLVVRPCKFIILDPLSKVRGTPTKDSWPGLTDLPDYIAYETYAPQPLRGIFTAAGDDLLLLLERLLSLNPLARCTASEALQVSVLVPLNMQQTSLSVLALRGKSGFSLLKNQDFSRNAKTHTFFNPLFSRMHETPKVLAIVSSPSLALFC